MSLLVEVSRAVFLKVGNIAPKGSEKQKGAKVAKGVIAHELCKTFFIALHRIFLCKLGNSHSSVALALARFIRTQRY